jgi:L-ascorbate metabolism protein UlaG (beta-lactamase superfamily)
MKGLYIVIAIIIILVAGYFLVNNDSENKMTTDQAVQVDPISHATAVLTWGDSVIYTDPVGGAQLFAEKESPDVILVTDIHGDHLNVETLEGIVTENTVIVVPQAVYDELSEPLQNQSVVVANGEVINQNNLSIEAIPMYNLPESEDSRHTKGRGNGYVVERDGSRIYIAGDTADIPEMRNLENIDMAFVPMNLPYTMDVSSAASAVLDFAPTKVYPYHYRGQDGLSDVQEFKRIVNEGNSDIEVILLNWYPDMQMEGENNEPDETEGEVEVFEISGKNFEFDVTEIRVQEGQTVIINFTSEQGLHDWVVNEFDASTSRVSDGESTSVTFVADQTGEFEFYCSVGNHRERGMVGTLIVE